MNREAMGQVMENAMKENMEANILYKITDKFFYWTFLHMYLRIKGYKNIYIM